MVLGKQKLYVVTLNIKLYLTLTILYTIINSKITEITQYLHPSSSNSKDRTMSRTGDDNSNKRCLSNTMCNLFKVLPEIWKILPRYFNQSKYKFCQCPDFFCNVPERCDIYQKNSRVSRFPTNSPDSRKNFVFLPKQALLEL